MLQTQSCSLWKASFFSPQLCYEAIYNSTGGIHTLIPAKFNFSPFRRSVTDASSSPCLQCMSSPGFNDTGRPPWRRGPRLTTMHFLKRTRVFVRGLSTSIRACQYDLKADMPKPGSQKLFFDTHSVVRLLEENVFFLWTGFSTQQAEVIVKLLVRTTNSNMEAIYNDMVTKVQQEIVLQRVMSHIAAVKKDMIILEKSEFSTLLAENEEGEHAIRGMNGVLYDAICSVHTALGGDVQKWQRGTKNFFSSSHHPFQFLSLLCCAVTKPGRDVGSENALNSASCHSLALKLTALQLINDVTPTLS
ncbi:mitochondrial calcium uniporter regulator 1 isoform X3 [Myripristis murdjan]|uniref:mitochondrial calcium uniporter regulator 1 isoform X3 n=1 Tax=Myripristis murdjan TaxID=586833 RepID=UPI0011764582|nr:uncharacterized protein LOC115379097 isoform X3 [Myripristis murdjan]